VPKSSVKLHLENLKLRIAVTEALAAGVPATPLEAGIYLTKSPGYLAVLRSRGTGPEFFLSGTTVMYRKEALDAWLASCKTRRRGNPKGRPHQKAVSRGR
jgi:hypothetical protein